MKPSLRKVFKSFSIELPIYAGLAVVYVFLVLHFLAEWLHQVFTKNRPMYALLALGLIIGQGYVLELVTRGLLGLVNGKKEK
ncbi:MAG TPA: hypothetical protein VHB20_02660 [Verrucomicrobiae bacterium]|nr:hypothetical protein [Verrucomicrobiae bacterium]